MMKMSMLLQALIGLGFAVHQALSGGYYGTPTLGTIVDIASADPDTFGTLVAAVQAAGLVETLSG